VEKAYIADLAPPDLRGTAYGLYHAAVGLTALPASLLMGLVWEHVSPAAAFTVGAALALASAALLLLVLGSPASRKEKS
jgi:MFS family permease